LDMGFADVPITSPLTVLGKRRFGLCLLLGLPTLALPLTLCVFLERWFEPKRPTTLARLERVEEKPRSDVNRLAFSPDGQTVAAVADKTIHVWRCRPDGVTHLATLEGHTDRVWALVFSPDGKTLASCSGDPLFKPKFKPLTLHGWWGPRTSLMDMEKLEKD